ncbi:TPA: 3-hydroxyacyl-[acyl-carrier-protein] dehydratase FabZ [Candidatus Acetothermia bacterium]|nr:3-hydroxyacyl-ACP dehydratase FabZ [Candidatus Bipolaricaulota bacterium]HAF69858.1 3-hydroxyacyl-[acyl-carrier-protein] dehydratase FabZ [Candidatus Acetothermia bacterium]
MRPDSDFEGLKQLLPLGYPYLLVDRVLQRSEGEVVAMKCVTANEPYFQGHFRPPYPSLMPGTMILEGMAQTAGLLLPEGGLAVLAGVERARFHRPVVPGDRLTYRARALRRRLGLLKAEVRAQVEGEPVAEATILLMELEDVGKAD